MRCDLHVHSRHSGPVTVPILDRILRESYSEPRAVYETARRRGMDLVTLTDHDTVAGALELAGRPDFFVSEEVDLPAAPGAAASCTWASSTSPRRSTSRYRRAGAATPSRSSPTWPSSASRPALNHPFSPLTGAARGGRPAPRVRRAP